MQTISRLPGGTLNFKGALRQSPPAPIAFTAAANTQTIMLFGMPPNYIIWGIRLSLVTAFAGPSSCKVTIGGSVTINSTTTTAPNIYSPLFFECVQPVTDQAFLFATPLSTFVIEAHDVTATFTTIGAQVKDITAGELEYSILYRPL